MGNEKLENVWKSTCKVILGGEIGTLEEFKEWLDEPLIKKAYSENSKSIDFKQIDFTKKFEPLNINEIKDIDSMAEAVKERAVYSRGIVLGNSYFIEDSSDVINSYYVCGSKIISDSKYIAFSDFARYCSYLFGSSLEGQSNYLIKCMVGQKRSRCFENHLSHQCSDCYYSIKLVGCRESMFSFGSIGKSYLIGNLELDRDRYYSIKNKILEEIRGILKKEKRIFSLFDLIEGAEQKEAVKEYREEYEENKDLEIIEKSFEKTTKIILGKSLTAIGKYKEFLQKNVPEVYSSKSSLSGKEVISAGILYKFSNKRKNLEKRLITEAEMVKIGMKTIEKENLENISMDLEKLSRILSGISYFTLNIEGGNTNNVIKSAIVKDSSDCYNGSDYVLCKKCAYSFWPRESEYIFGSSVVWNSSFCINSYYSERVNRCFEIDGCKSSSDLYFSHNCENVRESMFCFNVKNLRYSIGNASLNPEKYLKLKKELLEQIFEELENKKDLGFDVYNVGN